MRIGPHTACWVDMELVSPGQFLCSIWDGFVDHLVQGRSRIPAPLSQEGKYLQNLSFITGSGDMSLIVLNSALSLGFSPASVPKCFLASCLVRARGLYWGEKTMNLNGRSYNNIIFHSSPKKALDVVAQLSPFSS